jgi:hypothetical protein
MRIFSPTPPRLWLTATAWFMGLAGSGCSGPKPATAPDPDEQLKAIVREKEKAVGELLKTRDMKVFGQAGAKVTQPEDLGERERYSHKAEITIQFTTRRPEDHSPDWDEDPSKAKPYSSASFSLGDITAAYRFNKKTAAWEFVGYTGGKLPTSSKWPVNVTLDDVKAAFGEKAR